MDQYYQENYQFCPRCQTSLEPKGEGLACPVCRFAVYNNPAPATAVIIEYQNKILFAKRGVEPFKGEWDLPGGFAQAGESLEQAAMREVKEETGLKIDHLRYLGSFPDRYDGVATFTAGFLTRSNQSTVSAQDDVAELEWLTKEELPTTTAFTSVDQIIKRYLQLPTNKGKNDR